MEYALRYFSNGEMYFGFSSSYNDIELTAGQRDDESLRRADFKSGEIIIRVGEDEKSAVRVPFETISFETTLPPYFLRCMSTSRDEKLFDEFAADACIEIFDVNQLVTEIDASVSMQFGTGRWKHLRRAVTYLSKPQLIGLVPIEDRVFAKLSDKYAQQKEFRFVLVPEHPFPGVNSGLLLRLNNPGQFSRLLT